MLPLGAALLAGSAAAVVTAVGTAWHLGASRATLVLPAILRLLGL